MKLLLLVPKNKIKMCVFVFSLLFNEASAAINYILHFDQSRSEGHTTFGIMTFSIMTLSIMTFCIMTLSITM